MYDAAGALGEEDRDEIHAFISTLPVAFHEHVADFIQMGLTADEVKVIVSTARRHGDGWWKEVEDEAVVADIDAHIGKIHEHRGIRTGRNHVTTIRVALTDEEKSVLRAEYGGVTDLRFESDRLVNRSDHGFMNATRTISKVQLRRMIPNGSSVTEIGAKPEDAVMCGATEGLYYGVMPILDSSDVDRHSAAHYRVANMLKRSGRTALKPNQRRVAEIFLNDFDRMFTRRPVQEVVHRTDIVMSQDANYDIPMEDCVKFMHRNGAKAWLGSMVRCEQACIFVGKTRGRMPVVGFDYEADAERDVVRFNFRSSARPYVHKLSVFLPYQMCDGREWRVGGETYVYRVLSQTTSSQLYFGFFRVPSRTYQLNPKVYAPSGMVGMLRVVHAKADVMRGGIVGEGSFLIDQETFSRVLRDRLVASSETDAEAVRSVRSARVAVIVNGVRVTVDQPVAFGVVSSLASVTKVIAADMRKTGKRLDADMQRVIAGGGYERQGVMSALWESTVKASTVPGSLISMVRDRLGLLKSNEPRLAVEAMPEFVRRKDKDVIHLDEQQVFEVSKCRCGELADARAMVAGECGGLTCDEKSVLDEYVGFLERTVCAECVVEPERFFDAVDGYDECGLEQKLCDSGYVSSDSSSDIVSDKTVCVGGQQTFAPAEGVVRDALCEYREVLGLQMESAKSEGERWCMVLLRAGVDADVLKGAEDSRLSHDVLTVDAGLITSSVTKLHDPQSFHVVYDFDRRLWVDVKFYPNGQGYVPRNTSALVYTSSAFKIWNQPQLISRVDELLQDYTVGPLPFKITFVNGIYGCGKTREIVSRFREGDVYVTATRRSADRVRNELYPGSEFGKCNVMTFDSAVLYWSSRKERRGSDVVRVLYLDEFSMVHVAQAFWLIHVLRPERVVAYGDVHQITWKPFVNGLRCKLALPEQVLEIEHRVVTHRCRLAVVAATLRFYGEDSGIRPCNCCENVVATEEALRRVRIASVNQIPMEKGVKYITFTHADREVVQRKMQEAGLCVAGDSGDDSVEVCTTVHSLQGETYERVFLVRLDKRTKPGSLFFDGQYVNTAISRSKTETVFYTVSDEVDAVTVAIEDGNDERCRSIVRRSMV